MKFPDFTGDFEDDSESFAEYLVEKTKQRYRDAIGLFGYSPMTPLRRERLAEFPRDEAMRVYRLGEATFDVADRAGDLASRRLAKWIEELT